MKKATAALATLLILTTAGCTSSAQNGKTQAPLWAQGGQQKPQNEAGIVGQEGRKVGDTITLRDEDGHKMRVTLTGVAYRDALAKDKTLPLTGKYALAVALTLESENGGTFKGYGRDNLIKWSYGPEMNKASRYYDAPWDGCIDSYTPWGKVAAGQPYLAISSMNISRRGGNLLIEDSYGSIARWDLPQEDTGTGTEPATKYATTDC